MPVNGNIVQDSGSNNQAGNSSSEAQGLVGLPVRGKDVATSAVVVADGQDYRMRQPSMTTGRVQNAGSGTYAALPVDETDLHASLVMKDVPVSVNQGD